MGACVGGDWKGEPVAVGSWGWKGEVEGAEGLEKGVTAWGEARAKGLVDDRFRPVCCCDCGLAGVENALLFVPVALAINIDALNGFVVCWPGACNPVCMGGDRDPGPVWKGASEFCGMGGAVFGEKLCCEV